MASKSKKRRRRTAPPRPTTPASRRPVQAPRPRAPQRRPTRAPLSESPRRLYVYALGAAAVLGAMLIGLSQLSVHRETTAPTAGGGVGVTGIAATAALLDGIPQRGNVLGSPTAPARVVEYADLQCPFCALAANGVLPSIIRDYVRTGNVQLVFRGRAFIGPDSLTALQTAAAAGSQNRMWNVVELLYRNQGPENAWVTDELLRSVVAAAGASPRRVFAERDRAAVTARLAGWQRQADADGVRATPTFLVGPRGGGLRSLAPGVPALADFRAAIDEALAR